MNISSSQYFVKFLEKRRVLLSAKYGSYFSDLFHDFCIDTFFIIALVFITKSDAARINISITCLLICHNNYLGHMISNW
jgi:hypothetical protein